MADNRYWDKTLNGGAGGWRYWQGVGGKEKAIDGKTVVTTAGTPVSLGSANCGEGVTVIANPLNTGNVYVFAVGSTKTNVVPLAA